MGTLKYLLPGFLALAIGAWFGLQKSEYSLTTPPATLSQVNLPDVMGITQNAGQWAGKVVVLNHWASWCPPCVEEIPMLLEFQSVFAQQGVQVVGVAHDTQEAARTFGDQIGITYPSLVLTSGGAEMMISQGNAQGSALPFTAIFDRSGKLVDNKLGILSAEELQRMVSPLL